MSQNDKSYINILPAGINNIFCFFHFSASYIMEFGEIHEVNTWTTSKTVLKLFYINNGIPIQQQYIPTDGLADNWYITITDQDVDLFVEVGKLTNTEEYIPLITSNILSMPRTNQVNSTNTYMIDINDYKSDHDSMDNNINNNIYKTEILKPATKTKAYEKFEEYIHKEHSDLSSSK